MPNPQALELTHCFPFHESARQFDCLALFLPQSRFFSSSRYQVRSEVTLISLPGVTVGVAPASSDFHESVRHRAHALRVIFFISPRGLFHRMWIARKTRS